ncbi:MAG: autotransporter outer membrane beta-barrel domain-containing protein, partial [Candidatus Adiutrix sp.]|nr:autotransporter outer membrane beta-barrel domain-containing protein [Candidatus Adiutrix sp.]
DATWLDTAFNFTDTVASADSGLTGVYFNTIDLGNASAVRTLDATGAGLGSYWADSLRVNATSAPGAGQQWTGDLWLGGVPGAPGVATGAVGALDVILPAGTNLADYDGDGSGANPNYMLNVSGSLSLENGAAVNLRAASGNPFKNLVVDEHLQIVSSSAVDDSNLTESVPVNGFSELGASKYLFDMLVSQDGKKMLAKFLGGDLEMPVAKTYLQGITAALGTLGLGAELENRVIRNTFDPNVNQGIFKDGNRLGIMFGLEYTNLRLNTGSHVDSDNMNVVVGPAFRSESPIGLFGLGLFFEAGNGDYSAHNSYPSLEILGEGDAKYFGGGIGLRNDFAHGLYADLSMRAGSAETDLSIKDRAGANYNMSASYFGGHMALGKIFDFEDSGRLDLSTRLLWTRLGGDEVWTGAEERLSIDDAKSLRTQLGARYSREFSDVFSGYVGAAWDYEHDGTVSGRLDDVRIDEPSLEGSTGIAEVGFSITPVDNFSIDLGLQGYTGQREGAGGTAMISFSF